GARRVTPPPPISIRPTRAVEILNAATAPPHAPCGPRSPADSVYRISGGECVVGLPVAMRVGMRTTGSPDVLEDRRTLALQRVDEGFSVPEVADFFGVSPGSVRRWVAAFRRQGADALAARPVAGRPPKLTYTQEKIVGRWLDDNPTEHGFATELWTAPRLARLIE